MQKKRERVLINTFDENFSLAPWGDKNQRIPSIYLNASQDKNRLIINRKRTEGKKQQSKMMSRLQHQRKTLTRQKRPVSIQRHLRLKSIKEFDMMFEVSNLKKRNKTEKTEKHGQRKSCFPNKVSCCADNAIGFKFKLNLKTKMMLDIERKFYVISKKDQHA